MSRYTIIPVGKTQARQFVEEHHRHNEAPSPMQVSFAVGLEVEGELVAVATAGIPVARNLNDGFTLEVSRACVKDVHRNANSALYGAIGRAAQALGYRRLVTYTLHSESGSSLRAAGFTERTDVGVPGTWDRPNQMDRLRYDRTIWGERKNAVDEAKYRWERRLTA